MIQLGERIKEFRRRNGRTQEALANELGVTPKRSPAGRKGSVTPIWA